MNQSWDWPGSRWWRVDLHCHTPASSHDYRGDQEDWTGWVEAARDRGLHAVAITDHNTAAGIQHIQEAATRVENPPIIFPGVELTADDTHLLLLMDPECNQSHVEHMLAKMEIPVDEQGKDTSRSFYNVQTVLNKCDKDVLVVGAHINRQRGLLEHGGQKRIAELKHPNLVAVEFNPCEGSQDRSWINGSRPEIGRPISEVYASDSHRPSEIGRRFTWIKMTRPDLDGLRLALVDGSASLIPALSSNQFDPNNEHSDWLIEKIIIKGSRYMGNGSPMTIDLNPWMNTIIGGRGTGKSTVVDFCRKTLRRERELDDKNIRTDSSIKDTYSRRMRVPSDRRDEGLLTHNTSAEITYLMDKTRFIISWNQNGEGHPIIRVEEDAVWVSEEGDVQRRFPVRIYSQKQLFEVAQNPNILLDIVDSTQDVEGDKLKYRIEELKNQYLVLRAEARSKRLQASDIHNQRAIWEDTKRKIRSLQEGGQPQILNQFRKQRQYNNSWQQILDLSIQSIKEVEQSVSELAVAGFNDSLSEIETVNGGEFLIRIHKSLIDIVDDLQSKLFENIEKAKQDIQAIKSGPEIKLWNDKLAYIEQRFREAKSELALIGISDPSEYTKLITDTEARERHILDMQKKLEQSKELNDQALETLSEYRKARQELSHRRETFLDGHTSETLRLTLKNFDDIEDLSDYLSEHLGIVDRFEGDRNKILGQIIPKNDSVWDWNEYDQTINKIEKFTCTPVTRLPWKESDWRFLNALKKMTPESIDRLFLYLPQDSLEVSFMDRNNWRPLEQGSPGQQTAALLAFVLSQGSEPIIFDQPEDDLDNTIIYNLLVEQLRASKLQRQIIIVTHNPNIVVHGDAELVISLKVKSGQSRIACIGGLQESSVREEICRVMEGGEEAFKSRFRRIMPSQGTRK